MKRIPGFSTSGDQAEDADIEVVADDHPLVGVEHAQAMRHVLDRRREALVLRPEFVGHAAATPPRPAVVPPRQFRERQQFGLGVRGRTWAALAGLIERASLRPYGLI